MPHLPLILTLVSPPPVPHVSQGDGHLPPRCCVFSRKHKPEDNFPKGERICDKQRFIVDVVLLINLRNLSKQSVKPVNHHTIYVICVVLAPCRVCVWLNFMLISFQWLHPSPVLCYKHRKTCTSYQLNLQTFLQSSLLSVTIKVA